MSILDVLYALIIEPIKLLFDTIFTISYYVTNSSGISILILSVVMNMLLLPLYNRADKIQKEQNEKELKLKYWVDHIKKHFKGDERYMVLQAYYKQNNYKQTDMLKSSISLLLQIPFFMAAYSYLSNLLVIKNVSFGPISNLSLPDKLLCIGDFNVNVLPILMTIINIISSIVYAKGQPLKSKIQLFAVAFIFLILLYNSPSALLLYWTLNNVFSLFKNIVKKTSNPSFIFCLLLSIISVVGIVYITFNPLQTPLIHYGTLSILLLMNIPFIIKILKINIKIGNALIIDDKMFVLSMVLLAILTGILIPSGVISSSPAEFIDYHTLSNPLLYILNSFLLSTGIFVIWIDVYYFLMNNDVKRIFCLCFQTICIIAIINYLFFGKNLGTISNVLTFDSGLIIDNKEIIINIIIVILCIIVFAKIRISKKIFIIAITSFIIMSSINVSKIYSSYSVSKKAIQESKEIVPTISLSKNKKNVVLIVLDRAISSYVPYLFEENEELQKQYSGFYYYPNTLSFGWHTTFAVPPVFGGYEYTPKKMNDRNDVLLEDKHNEALKLLPILFSNNDYDVTIFDPPYAGYEQIPNLSIFNDIRNTKAYNTIYGTFEPNHEILNNNLNRILFAYSIMKVSPLCFQNILYNYGAYNSIDYYNDIYNESVHTQLFPKESFIYNYSVLDNLSKITNANNDKASLFIMTNYATHETSLLQEPEYAPSKGVDNIEYDKTHMIRYSLIGNKLKLETRDQYEHYESDMSAFIQIGKWFDHLKELDIYDNTRIIIVSDHGHFLGQFEDLLIDDLTEEQLDVLQFNPVLLYKDFDSNGNIVIKDDFMTNADVPTLVMKNLINNPINPYTGKTINSQSKLDDEYQLITPSDTYLLSRNKNNYQYDIDEWLEVKENIFNVNNWALHN